MVNPSQLASDLNAAVDAREAQQGAGSVAIALKASTSGEMLFESAAHILVHFDGADLSQHPQAAQDAAAALRAALVSFFEAVGDNAKMYGATA